jgi:anti-sigma regulatory factor (Ser/Thr protein kinase)
MCPEQVIDTVRLAVSELATNAVRHSETGAQARGPADLNEVQTFELLLEVTATYVRVSVWDRDPAPPVLKQVGTGVCQFNG